MGISNFKEGNASCSGSWLTLTISCTQNPNGVICFVDIFFLCWFADNIVQFEDGPSDARVGT